MAGRIHQIVAVLVVSTNSRTIKVDLVASDVTCSKFCSSPSPFFRCQRDLCSCPDRQLVLGEAHPPLA